MDHKVQCREEGSRLFSIILQMGIIFTATLIDACPTLVLVTLQIFFFINFCPAAKTISCFWVKFGLK